MKTILDTVTPCKCFDCTRDAYFHPNYCQILQKILPTNPVERCRFMQKLYFWKPFVKNTWTKDWKSVTHRDYIFRNDHWSIDFPEKPLDMRPEFIEYTCRKWCKEVHNVPLSGDAYTATGMPNFFEKPRRAIYSDPRQCSTTYEHDYTWQDDYRVKRKFPGWCLKGCPPQYADEDRTF